MKLSTSTLHLIECENMFKASVIIYKDTASFWAETLPLRSRQEIADKQMKIPNEISKVYMIHLFAPLLQNVMFDE